MKNEEKSKARSNTKTKKVKEATHEVKEKKEKEKKTEKKEKKTAKKTAEEKELYSQYQKLVKSKIWKENIREAILERDGYRCRFCGMRQEDGAILNVHHLDYSHINSPEEQLEHLDDLTLFCATCHRYLHRCPSTWKRLSLKNYIKNKNTNHGKDTDSTDI